MKDGLLLSFSTLSRNIKKLVSKGYVSRLSRDEYIFNRNNLKSPDEFTRIEFNEIAAIMDGCDRVQGVRLRVFAFLIPGATMIRSVRSLKRKSYARDTKSKRVIRT